MSDCFGCGTVTVLGLNSGSVCFLLLALVGALLLALFFAMGGHEDALFFADPVGLHLLGVGVDCTCGLALKLGDFVALGVEGLALAAALGVEYFD